MALSRREEHGIPLKNKAVQNNDGFLELGLLVEFLRASVN